MTVFKSGPTKLPVNFFVIMCSWVPFSSAWMLWNEEARTFAYRKLFKIKAWIMDEKLNSLQSKEIRPKNGECYECDIEDICPNCIARKVIKKRHVVGRTISTISPSISLPGSVD